MIIWTKSKEPKKQISTHGLPSSHVCFCVQKPDGSTERGRYKNHRCAYSLHLPRMATLSVLAFVTRHCKSVWEKFWIQSTTLKYFKASHLACLGYFTFLTKHFNQQPTYDPRKMHNASLLVSLDSALRPLRNFSLLWSSLISSHDTFLLKFGTKRAGRSSWWEMHTRRTH